MVEIYSKIVQLGFTPIKVEINLVLQNLNKSKNVEKKIEIVHIWNNVFLKLHIAFECPADLLMLIQKFLDLA